MVMHSHREKSYCSYLTWVLLILHVIVSLRELLGGHTLQNNEGMEMAVHEWLQMQEPDLCHNGISKLLQRCGR